MPAIGIIGCNLRYRIGSASGGRFAALSVFYNLVVGLSTMAAVIPAPNFCALAMDSSQSTSGGRQISKPSLVEVIAFVFSVYVYGCGAEPVLYGVVLLLLGIPVFVWNGVARSLQALKLTPATSRERAACVVGSSISFAKIKVL